MARDKVEEYIRELKELVKERTADECPAWLHPQIEAAAMNRLLLWKILEELTEDSSKLILETEGYNNQAKKDANPLLTHYDKIQRTLLQQYEAIGLNYKTTPSKVKEEVKKGEDKKDSLSNLLGGVKDELDEMEEP